MEQIMKNRTEAQRRTLLEFLRINEKELMGLNDDIHVIRVAKRLNTVLHSILSSELLCDLLSHPMEKASHHEADFSSLEERVASSMEGKPYGYWEHPADEETRKEHQLKTPNMMFSIVTYDHIYNAGLAHIVLEANQV